MIVLWRRLRLSVRLLLCPRVSPSFTLTHIGIVVPLAMAPKKMSRKSSKSKSSSSGGRQSSSLPAASEGPVLARENYYVSALCRLSYPYMF